MVTSILQNQMSIVQLICQTFIWEILEVIKEAQNTRKEVRLLIQLTTANRLRHASDPVHPSTRYMYRPESCLLFFRIIGQSLSSVLKNCYFSCFFIDNDLFRSLLKFNSLKKNKPHASPKMHWQNSSSKKCVEN